MASNTARERDFERTDEQLLRLRQVVHDIANHVSVISMGMAAICDGCKDAEVAEMCALIQTEGVEPLKKVTAELRGMAKKLSRQ